MLVIKASFVMLLSTRVPVLGFQMRVEPAGSASTQGARKIGTTNVYDISYKRPSGLSIEEAGNLGFLVSSSEPTAWESADHSVFDAHALNTGNLVWSLGARMLLGNSSELIMGPENWPREESLSAIFIATGPLMDGSLDKPIENKSHLIENEGMTHSSGYFFDAFTTVVKPTLIVGMGIGEYDGDTDFKCMDVVDEDKRAQFDKIQNRITALGGFVGLRGKCSESALRQYGYSGFESLGCPSLFINTKPQLGSVLQTKYEALSQKAWTSPADLKVAVSMPSDSHYDHRVVPFLAKILNFFPNSILVNQNDQADMLFGKGCDEIGVEKPSRQSFIYYDALEWRQKLSQVDLVVSARIHGGMIGIAAETPTIVIPIDMRVLEMVEAMQLTYILPADIPDDVVDFVVKASSKFDGDAFDAQRRTYAARYKELFNNVGLTVNPELSNL